MFSSGSHNSLRRRRPPAEQMDSEPLFEGDRQGLSTSNSSLYFNKHLLTPKKHLTPIFTQLITVNIYFITQLSVLTFFADVSLK